MRLGYSSTLIDLGAKLEWLVAKKASFNMLGIRHAIWPFRAATIAWLHAGIEALLTAQRDALFWGEAY